MVISVLLVALVAAAGVWAAVQLRSGSIYPGVCVGGLDLGGCSVEEARSALARDSEDLRANLRLHAADKEWPAGIRDLGGRLDIDACVRATLAVGRRGNIFRRLQEILSVRRSGRRIPAVYVFDKATISSRLAAVAACIDRPAVDASLSLDSGAVVVSAEKPGVRLNSEDSISAISRVVNSGGREIELAAEVVQPKVKAADFRGIDGVLASYSTPYHTWERSRAHNIRRACQAVDGTLLKPGGVFSYNAAVGPRVREYGYLDAPQFVRGEIRQGPGGGVCQVSTTLYNAALMADLKIRERSHHSRPVPYVPLGRDATVEYGLLDLKFENTTGAPVYVCASAEGGRVTIRLLGRESGGRVELVSAGRSVVPARVVERPNSELPPGERVVEQPGRAGHRVRTYRVVRLDGKEVRRELISRDYYPPETRVVAVGEPM